MTGSTQHITEGCALALCEQLSTSLTPKIFFDSYIRIYKSKVIFSDKKLFLTFRDPSITRAGKEANIKYILELLMLDKELLPYCLVILKNNLGYLLPAIVKVFLSTAVSYFSEEYGIVISSRTFSKPELSRLGKAIAEKLSCKKVQLYSLYDPQINDGIIVRTSTQNINYTIYNKLTELKKQVKLNIN